MGGDDPITRASAFRWTLHRGREPVLDDTLRPWRVPDDNPPSALAVGAITIRLRRTDHLVRIEVPLVGADQLYYRAYDDRLVISNDPRRLSRDATIDPSALCSLLELGAIVPPLSMWREVRRFTPGRDFVIRLENLAVQLEDAAITWPDPVPGDPSLPPGRQADTLASHIDEILVAACPNRDPVILFSGGVDSGVLAARAAALGWRDTVLLNCALGDDDPESRHAAAMARALGLEMQTVMASDGAFELLDAIGTTYRQPFTDHSALPTYELAMAAVRRFPATRPVIDGTGADGAFGLFGKAQSWNRLYRVPGALRRLANRAYNITALWRHASRIEYGTRVLARTAGLPAFVAAVAQNGFAGVLYHAPAKERDRVLALLEGWMVSTLPTKNDAVRLAGLDLALVCSDRFAQKDKAIFDSAERGIVYPYLDRRIVALALTRAVRWPGSSEPKRVLKELLARQVPANMVYRPKSGFAGPLARYMSHPRWLDAFDRVLSADNELTQLLDLRRIATLRPALAGAKPIPNPTYSFIWAVVFTGLWIEQQHT